MKWIGIVVITAIVFLLAGIASNFAWAVVNTTLWTSLGVPGWAEGLLKLTPLGLVLIAIYAAYKKATATDDREIRR
jgi:hypothetical protein